MAADPAAASGLEHDRPPTAGSGARPASGMLVFSAFIYRLTGNPFMWTMQNVAWGRVVSQP